MPQSVVACFWNIVSWLHSQSSSHPVSSYFNLTLLKLQTGITLHGSALSAMPSDIWGYIISVGGWPEPFSAVAVWGGGHPNSLPRGTPRPNSALQLDCRAVLGYPWFLDGFQEEWPSWQSFHSGPKIYIVRCPGWDLSASGYLVCNPMGHRKIHLTGLTVRCYKIR